MGFTIPRINIKGYIMKVYDVKSRGRTMATFTHTWDALDLIKRHRMLGLYFEEREVGILTYLFHRIF